MNIHSFQLMKQQQQKITMVTCYDYWSAKIIAATEIDCVLVGDSVAMVMHGYENTIPATVEMMALHTAAVARGIGKKFLITDLPFLAHRKGLKNTMDAVEKIMRAGAQAIKIECNTDDEKMVRHIVNSGVPVIGHVGLTGQSIHQLGGHKVQGKQEIAAKEIMQKAKMLQQAGCFAILLECIPPQLAKQITEQLTAPTIGIGAGANVDGQVLVLHDLLGMNADFKPKFLKQYFTGFANVQAALNTYNQEVKSVVFPAEEHCY